MSAPSQPDRLEGGGVRPGVTEVAEDPWPRRPGQGRGQDGKGGEGSRDLGPIAGFPGQKESKQRRRQRERELKSHADEDAGDDAEKAGPLEWRDLWVVCKRQVACSKDSRRGRFCRAFSRHQLLITTEYGVRVVLVGVDHLRVLCIPLV